MNSKKKILLVSLDAGDYKYSLQLAYLKSYFQRKHAILDIDVKIIIWNKFRMDLRQQLFIIYEENPDYLAFSTDLSNISDVLVLCDEVKKFQSEVKIILGGPAVSIESEKFLKQHNSVDLIVRGEGEVTFSEVIESLEKKEKSLSSINGITYMDGEKIICSPDRDLIANLDLIPSPFLTHNISEKEFDKDNMILEISRGCAYNCSYCTNKKFYNKIRHFSLERIKSELRLMMKNKVKSLWLLSPCLNMDKKHFLSLMQELKLLITEFESDISFIAEMKSELITKDLVESLNGVTFKFIAVGLQSVRSATNKITRRTYNRKKFVDGIDLLKKSKIPVIIDTICGLPGESFYNYFQTLKFAIAQCPDKVSRFMLEILPGTKLRENIQDYGIKFSIFKQYDSYFDYGPNEILESNTMSFDELYRAKLFSNSVVSEHRF